MRVTVYGLSEMIHNKAHVDLSSNDGKHSLLTILSVRAAIALKEALDPDFTRDERGYTWKDYVEAAEAGVDL